MGLALRGCLVLVLGATAERRNLLFGPTLVCRGSVPLVYPAYPGKAQVKHSNELGRAFNGHLADHHPSPVRAHVGPGSTASTPISPDIGEHIEARLTPFPVDGDPGHQGPHRRRPGRSADTPGARAGAVLHRKSA